MYAERALELVRELERSPDSLPSFNDEKIRLALEEMRALYEKNSEDVNLPQNGDGALMHGVHLRHIALERNQRCILSYLYNRLLKIRQMRWEFGCVLPADIKHNLCEPEVQWFSNYNKLLATYMKSIGGNRGLDLMQEVKPPKSLYIEVRCLVDYGSYELEDGNIILLNRNTQHLVPRSQCEALIRQGVLQHIK